MEHEDRGSRRGHGGDTRGALGFREDRDRVARTKQR